MITEGNGGIAAGPGDHKRWERVGKVEGSGAVTGKGSGTVCVKSERYQSSEKFILRKPELCFLQVCFWGFGGANECIL